MRRPQSNILTNSKIIRKELNKLFPETRIRNCRTTAGDSILIKFDDEKTAAEEVVKWEKDFLGGNNGILRAKAHSAYEIIQYVDKNCTEEEIKEAISEQYPDTSAELFPFFVVLINTLRAPSN